MNVLYFLGSVPNHKQLFINREIEALQQAGIQISILVINPFYEKGPLGRFSRLFTPGFNPFMLLWSPVLNFLNGRPLLFSRSNPLYSGGYDKQKINGFRLLAASLFLENSFRKLCKSGVRIDHVHSHHLFSSALFTPWVAKNLKVPYSHTLHTLSGYFKPAELARNLTQASFLRTVTLETFHHFSSNGFNPRIYAISNGVDVNAFPMKVEEGKADRLEILAIGYLFDKKGFDVLINSCDLLHSRNILFYCTIIGEGPEKIPLQKLIAEHRLEKHIRLIPFLSFDKLVPYFLSASVLAVPSRDPRRSTRDGLPTVILEAMAMGLPVVASDFAGISDAIVHEETGLLVPSENEEQLANAMVRISNDRDLRKKIIARAGEHVRQNFSLRSNMAQLSALFQSTVVIESAVSGS